MRKIFFLNLVVISFVFLGCGGVRVYTLSANATMRILNEKGEAFKKEDGSRFEVREIYVSGHYINTEEDELTYILNPSVSGKPITMFDSEDTRNREEEILLHKLKITQGIVIIDKNDEYKPKIQYLVNASITKKKISDSLFAHSYEFEDTVILEKK